LANWSLGKATKGAVSIDLEQVNQTTDAAIVTANRGARNAAGE